MKKNRDVGISLRYNGWLPATDGEHPVEQKRLIKTVNFKHPSGCRGLRLQDEYPVLWMGSAASLLLRHHEKQFTFNHLATRSSRYSFDQPQKDESLMEPHGGFEPESPGLVIQH